MGTKFMLQTNADISCGAGTPKTVLAYKALSGVAAKVLRFGVSFDGTSSTDARATIDFQKNPSTAGTATDISSEIATLSGQGTSLGTALQNFTAEPGSGANTRIIRPHRQVPGVPFEALAGFDLAPSEQIGLRVYGASGKNCRAWMEVELG